MQMCKQMAKEVYIVPSFTNPDKNYYVHLFSEQNPVSCTCPAFANSKKKECKHIRHLLETVLCNWHEQTGKALIEDGVCPKCGGVTMNVLVGV